MLIDYPRAVHYHEVNAMPVGEMLETALPTHVVDVGLGRDVVRLNRHHTTRFVRWGAATIVKNKTTVNLRPFDNISTRGGEEAAGLVVAMALETHSLPPTALAVMRGVGGQDVLVMSTDDRLAIPCLQLIRPPLQLLDHAS